MGEMTETSFLGWKKNITLLMIAQSISMFGTSIVMYALMWSVTLQTQSGWMMTLYILFGFLPTLLLSPYAGVWADRYPRKKLIIASDTVIALATAVLAVLIGSGMDSIYWLLAVAAVRACGNSVQLPAVLALMPQLVPAEHLTRVNGIQGILQSLNFFVAPVLSAALLAWLPVSKILWIDVITALIGVTITAFFVHVRTDQNRAGPSDEGYLANIMEGFRYIRSHPYLMPFFVYIALLLMFVAAPSFLSPLQVVRSFGPEVWRLTAIEITFSSGMLIGGLLISTWGGFANRVHTLILAVTIFGVFIIGMGVTPNFWLYLVWMTILGVALPMFNTVVTSLLQEKVDDAVMGRVFSVHTMISSSMMPLGLLIFGPVADVVSIEWVMVVTGALVLIQAVVMSRHRVFVLAGIREPAMATGKGESEG